MLPAKMRKSHAHTKPLRRASRCATRSASMPRRESSLRPAWKATPPDRLATCARCLSLVCAGSTHAPFTFLYREHACPLDFSLHAGAVKRFRSSGLFSQEKRPPRRPASFAPIWSFREGGKAGVSPWRIEKSRKSRQSDHLRRMARRACGRGEPENRENLADSVI